MLLNKRIDNLQKELDVVATQVKAMQDPGLMYGNTNITQKNTMDVRFLDRQVGNLEG